jgi:hypothetical protein
MIRLSRVQSGDGTTASAAAPEPRESPTDDPAFVQKKKLKKIIERLVVLLRERSDGRLEYDIIYTALMKRDGVKQGDATLEQLKARILHLERWLEEAPCGR